MKTLVGTPDPPEPKRNTWLVSAYGPNMTSTCASVITFSGVPSVSNPYWTRVVPNA